MRAVIAALMLCTEIGWAQTPVRMRISEVQGPGEESPAIGRLVTVRGRVTARRNNGFWIESDGDADNDPRTSEGLFVFTSTSPAEVAVAQNIVDVTGIVAEFRPAADPDSPPLTETVEPAVTFVSTSSLIRQRTLPSSGDWERFEGMVVQTFGSVVGPTLGTLNETTGTATSNGVFYLAVDSTRPFRDVTGVQGPGLLRGIGPGYDATVAIGGKFAPVTYFGPAPGLIEGVVQINAQVPDDLTPGTAARIILWSGGSASSSTATIAIR